jgi:ribonucleoside-diphosphate reductase alpha chain
MSVQQDYSDALEVFEVAKKGVLDALLALHKKGVYPSPPEGMRFKLLDERPGRTSSVTLGFGDEAVSLYVTSGEFTDGAVGEIFLSANKQGSFVSGLLDGIATLTSICLQYGVPLSKIVDKFKYTRFEPSGLVNRPQIRQATSVLDYVGKWLERSYIPPDPDPIF